MTSFLLSRIQRAGVDLAAGGLDILHQRRELVAIPAAGEDRKAFGGKFLGDLGADEIAGPDDGGCRVSLGQGRLLR